MKKNILIRIFRKCFYKTYYLINPIKCARKMGVTVGENCDFNKMPNFGGEPYLIEIGNYNIKKCVDLKLEIMFNYLLGFHL